MTTPSVQDETRIASALLAAYPSQDRLALDHVSLSGLISSVGHDAQNFSARKLDAILWTWMRLADTGTHPHGGG